MTKTWRYPVTGRSQSGIIPLPDAGSMRVINEGSKKVYAIFLIFKIANAFAATKPTQALKYMREGQKLLLSGQKANGI